MQEFLAKAQMIPCTCAECSEYAFCAFFAWHSLYIVDFTRNRKEIIHFSSHLIKLHRLFPFSRQLGTDHEYSKYWMTGILNRIIPVFLRWTLPLIKHEKGFKTSGPDPLLRLNAASKSFLIPWILQNLPLWTSVCFQSWKLTFVVGILEAMKAS